jgi:hypothetical protein
MDWFLDPVRILGAGAGSAAFLRWAAVLDLIGYYLATAVLAYVLWRILRPRDPMVADLATLAAFGYALIGGAGAAVLAIVGPMLMNEYAIAASPGEQELIAVQFDVLLEVVWRSIWQFLDGILMAAWWLGIGFLVRADRPGLSRLSFALGVLAGVFSVLNALGIGFGRDAVLGIVFALWTIWWAWLLIILRRAPLSLAP